MKRYIKSSNEVQSNLSFDFSWPDDYDEMTVLDVAEAALEPYPIEGYEFISMNEQYDGYDKAYDNVSQLNVTFTHDGAYDGEAIESKLDDGLSKLGLSLEGVDFQSLS